MAKVLPFPEERKDLQRFQLLVNLRSDGSSNLDMAAAWGVLLEPAMDRNAKWQEFLVLKDSLIRITQGISDQSAAIDARDKLRAYDALERVGEFERVTQDAVFPSLSRAANFACGRAENGWIQWGIKWNGVRHTMDEVYKLDKKGQFELVYYECPPKVIWIPR